MLGGLSWLIIIFVTISIILYFLNKQKIINWLNSKPLWNSTSYWLKGGIIGLIIGIILSLLPANSLLIIPLIAVLPLTLFLCTGEFCNSTPHIITIILVILGCFLIGILIGWTYGKLKSKKS